MAYQKVCGDTFAEVSTWAGQVGPPSACGICHPGFTVVISDEVARRLGDRFQGIVPEGFHAWERDGMLRYAADSSVSVYGGGTSGSFIGENLGNGETV